MEQKLQSWGLGNPTSRENQKHEKDEKQVKENPDPERQTSRKEEEDLKRVLDKRSRKYSCTKSRRKEGGKDEEENQRKRE